MTKEPWSVPVRLSAVGRGIEQMTLAPDEATRARIARDLNLVGVPKFEAEVRLAPWLDGVELTGRWSAEVVYSCGVTLEPYHAPLEGSFTVRAVPPGSVQDVEPSGEIELDLESEDPPDVLEGESIDVGAYLVEHLSLELDPFPRKPGAVFEPPPAEEPESPFAVLRKLTPKE